MISNSDLMNRGQFLSISLVLLSFSAISSAIAQPNLPSSEQLRQIRQLPNQNIRDLRKDKIKQEPSFDIPQIKIQHDTENLEALALESFKSGDYKSAVLQFGELGIIYPEVAKYQIFRARAYDRLNSPILAISTFSRAIKLSPENPNIYVERGIVFKKLKSDGEALRDFDKAISLDPNHFSAYLHRGELYARSREFEKAIADFNKAIEINSESAHPYYYRGTVFAWMKKRDKAIQDISHAAKLLEKSNQKAEHKYVVEILEKLKATPNAPQ